MNRIALFTGIVAALSLIGALALIDESKAKVRHLLRDGRYEAAAPLLEDLYHGGDHSIFVLQELSRVQLKIGDVDYALKVLENAPLELVEEELANTYRASLDLDRYSALASINPKVDRLRELVTISHLKGDRTAEMQGLESLAARDEAEPTELLRLTALLAEAGRFVETHPVFRKLAEEGLYDVGAFQLEAKMLARGGSDGRSLLLAQARAMVTAFPEKVASFLWSLLDAGAPDVAMRILDAAESSTLDRNDVFPAYLAVFRAVNREEEVLDRIFRQISSGELSPERRSILLDLGLSRADGTARIGSMVVDGTLSLDTEQTARVGHALLEKTNNPESAAILFRRIAENHGPEHSSLQQLLFIWGPRPSPEATVWLRTKADSAAPTERPRWLEHLLSIGDTATVLGTLSKVAHPFPQDLDDVLLRTLGATDDKRAVERLLRNCSTSVTDAGRLIRFAEAARATDNTGLTVSLFERALTIAPADAVAQVRLALLYAQTDRADDALPLLRRFFSLPDEQQRRVGTGDRLIALYHYGLGLERAGEKKSAKATFEIGFATSSARPASARDEVVHAGLASKVQGPKAGAEVMRALSAQRPLTRNERDVWARLLLDAGEASEANRVLFPKIEER